MGAAAGIAGALTVKLDDVSIPFVETLRDPAGELAAS